jgi:hypothetical protein
VSAQFWLYPALTIALMALTLISVWIWKRRDVWQAKEAEKREEV